MTWLAAYDMMTSCVWMKRERGFHALIKKTNYFNSFSLRYNVSLCVLQYNNSLNTKNSCDVYQQQQ